jgi:hypothetical protein
LEEQKLHLQLLNQASQQMRVFGQFITLPPPAIIRSSETGFSSHHTINSEDDVSSQAGAADILHEGSAENSASSCCHQHNINPLPLNVRDPRLIEYLSELHLDRMSIEKVTKLLQRMIYLYPKVPTAILSLKLKPIRWISQFLQEEYTYDDVMHFMTKEDLKNLKLK